MWEQDRTLDQPKTRNTFSEKTQNELTDTRAVY